MSKRSKLREKYPREYRIWQAMKARCYAPSCKDSGYYQENSIQVCDRWRYSFDNFIEDMGKAPDEYSIDRKDNLGDYCPENCRWADNNTQARNKSNNILFTYRDETMCLKDLAIKYGIKYTTLYQRIFRRNLTIKGAIEYNGLKSNNTSGVSGVSYHKGHKKWVASYTKDKKYVRIGEYDTKEEAIQAMKLYGPSKG